MSKKRIGNFLILGGVALIIFTYLPLVDLYLIPASAREVPTGQGLYISIPKIGASSKVIENVDPWNQAAYSKALDRGVAQAKGSALPGEGKTVFLFAHSSEVPWKITRQNTQFLKLGDLANGDPITLTDNGKKYTYRVVDKRVVWPEDIKYLKDTSTNQLILQTCVPIGTSLQRLLVFAVPS